MKSERRHELQTNALLDWLQDAIEKWRPYQNAIIGGLVVVVIALLALSMWRSRQEAQAAEAWDAFHAPLLPKNPNELMQVGGKHPNTAAADWGKVMAADDYLAGGVEGVFRDKKQGDQLLDQAEKLYQTALASSQQPLLRERAMFGVARAQEAQGKLTDAKTAYEALNTAYPENMFKDIVAERLKAIGKDDAKKFYDDFKSFDPKAMAAKEKEAATKEKEKSAASPRAERESLALPSDNPPEEPKKPLAEKQLPKPDAPKTESPKTDAPKTDAPKTDAPKTDAPKTEAPKIDAPKTDAPKTDAPKTDAPKTDAPKAEPPKPEAPKK